MSSVPADKFTLVIPTYNRPRELSRLLDYLRREQATFPILVLDSSAPAEREDNSARLARADPNVSVVYFDSATPPWEKFWRGSELVKTEYCAFCADDDLVMVNSLAPLIDFLDTHPDHSMVHGWYFSFYDSGQFGITSSVYRGASIDEDDPLARLRTLFRRYEALTYGIHRTRVQQHLMHAVQGVRSMLGRELLGGALAVAAGKAARLPVFYYGRALSASHPYTGWHPLEMLISSPAELYRDYSTYREVLAGSVAESGGPSRSREELDTILDLVHFRYLSEYVKPPVMDYLIEQSMAGRSTADAMQGMWSVLASADPGMAKCRAPLLRRIKRRLVRRRNPSAIRSVTAGGTAREYAIYDAFLSQLPGKTSPRLQIAELLRTLNNYE